MLYTVSNGIKEYITKNKVNKPSLFLRQWHSNNIDYIYYRIPLDGSSTTDSFIIEGAYYGDAPFVVYDDEIQKIVSYSIIEDYNLSANERYQHHFKVIDPNSLQTIFKIEEPKYNPRSSADYNSKIYNAKRHLMISISNDGNPTRTLKIWDALNFNSFTKTFVNSIGSNAYSFLMGSYYNKTNNTLRVMIQSFELNQMTICVDVFDFNMTSDEENVSPLRTLSLNFTSNVANDPYLGISGSHNYQPDVIHFVVPTGSDANTSSNIISNTFYSYDWQSNNILPYSKDTTSTFNSSFNHGSDISTYYSDPNVPWFLGITQIESSIRDYRKLNDNTYGYTGLVRNSTFYPTMSNNYTYNSGSPFRFSNNSKVNPGYTTVTYPFTTSKKFGVGGSWNKKQCYMIADNKPVIIRDGELDYDATLYEPSFYDTNTGNLVGSSTTVNTTPKMMSSNRYLAHVSGTSNINYVNVWTDPDYPKPTFPNISYPTTKLDTSCNSSYDSSKTTYLSFFTY